MWTYEIMQACEEIMECNWEMTVGYTIQKTAEPGGELSSLDIEDIGEILVPLPGHRHLFRESLINQMEDSNVDTNGGTRITQM
jgi:hypothetical protein